ncbi:MAG: hypothetical protein JRE23_16410, partial [Deltaproteobacteria bacterium]|nr:hypothetical protein [Deltaproteobacteria bacterium]
LKKVKEQGRKVVCANNLHSLALANQVYAANFNDWAVPYMYRSPDGGGVIWTVNSDFRDYVGYKGSEEASDLSLYQTPKKYKCPSDRQKASLHSSGVEQGDYQGALVSYGYNIEDWYPSIGGSYEATMSLKVLGYKMSSIKQPAEKLHFNDGQDLWSIWRGANYIDGWDVLDQKGTMWDYKNAGVPGPTMYRHSDSANLVFYDGHVESMDKTKLWIPEDFEQEPYKPGIWVKKGMLSDTMKITVNCFQETGPAGEFENYSCNRLFLIRVRL